MKCYTYTSLIYIPLPYHIGDNITYPSLFLSLLPIILVTMLPIPIPIPIPIPYHIGDNVTYPYSYPYPYSLSYW